MFTTDDQDSASSPLPLPPIPDLPELGMSYAYIAVASVDADGRLSDRSSLKHLGWKQGLRLTISVLDGIVVLAHAATGSYAVGDREYLRLPAQIRRCARIENHDRVLLAASRNLRTLAVYSPAAVRNALWSFDSRPWCES